MRTDNIKIEVDGKELIVPYNRYVSAKTKDLREFGYEGLKEESVSAQLDLLLGGKKWTTVIGCVISSDKPSEIKKGKK